LAKSGGRQKMTTFFYPHKKSKIKLLKHSYIKPKTHDLILTISGLLMMISIGNLMSSENKYLPVIKSITTPPDTLILSPKIGSTIDASEAERYRLFPYLSSKKFIYSCFLKNADSSIVLKAIYENDSIIEIPMSNPVYENIKSWFNNEYYKKITEIQKENPIYEKLTGIDIAVRTILSILTIILVVILMIIIAALSCSLSCNGQESLATLVLFFGVPLDVLIAVLLLNVIWKRKKINKS